jgi:A/G-specific adenine glycosylase
MADFRNELTTWYKENGRNLPWRGTNNPYYIWISEIILQQTRVDQGKSYYERFVLRFPDVKSLAAAEQEEVLKLWQGLGYYSRARNLHFAAKQIVEKYDGIFPNRYEEIIRLKGIGDYTAAAISSIAFGLPYAVVDGNVYRVLSRLFGVQTPIDSPKGKKQFAEIAQQLIEEQDPGIFNQAMMEFGALQCLPRNPDCENCPLSLNCFAYLHREIDKLPVKSKKIAKRNRYFNYLVIKTDNKYYLEKRKSGDIWENLYQFPLLETSHHEIAEQLIRSEEWQRLFNGNNLAIESVSHIIVHQLTHQKLHIRFWEITAEKEIQHNSYLLIPWEDISQYPVPKPIDNYLSKAGLNILSEIK